MYPNVNQSLKSAFVLREKMKYFSHPITDSYKIKYTDGNCLVMNWSHAAPFIQAHFRLTYVQQLILSVLEALQFEDFKT